MLCNRYSKTKQDAEDILQEAFIRIFKNIQQYNNQGSFEGWMRTIVINTALENLRKKKIEISPIDILEDENKFEDYYEDLKQMELKDLLKIIQGLPHGSQVVFNLFVLEGYSHKEIAELLGITDGTSKSQLARARLLLQNALQKDATYNKLII